MFGSSNYKEDDIDEMLESVYIIKQLGCNDCIII